MSAPRRKLTTVGKSLAQLSKQPIPYLKPAVKSLRLDLAPKNGHWGARHFLKEDLPRIAYANPRVTYKVNKFRQLTKEAPWKPSLQLEFADGATHEIEVDGKRSEEIMKDLMKIAGGPKPTPSSH
ncbi:ribosomal l51/s25/CI-B8 domain-containing protein [Rhizoctonia solani AG-1 IA]|uniref:Mitochondrial ribosomal protein L51 / S25 / CI-B8 domain n=2 Tax=Rhizoctonia solani TaxID=456999 RepID=A0A8H7LJZ3_9AGAM|nr:ribosomal l51/s25/CI-B8 domain-containing protein [Rhizoctonia solani AG-1 IA]KAF8679512.1 Mitochondrial ribosomal protein L51 / S25 / CI-B8 domain [Rhizoctonia solani]CAE6422986.1 unnamed protein product [Rhizoctonia solani]